MVSVGNVTPLGGNKFFLLVVDDYILDMWLELLRSKDEAYSHFKKIKVMAEADGNCKLRVFRSDRGGEFNSIEFREYCEQSGIKHFSTAPYTP